MVAKTNLQEVAVQTAIGQSGRENELQPAKGQESQRPVVHRDPADVRTIFQVLTVTLIVLALFMLSALGNAWQYWRRPDRIVVDRSSGRVLMINNREFGETEAAKMTPDRPGDEDKKYLVGEFMRLLYAVNPATRAADVKSALEMMIPQSAAKFAAYLKEQR